MSKLRQIKRRIKSVDSIAKVTHAMQLVAASRMRRAQERAAKGKSYSEKIKHIMVRLAQGRNGNVEPMLDLTYGQLASTVLLIVYSPQRGLAGSLPGSLARHTLKVIADYEQVGKQVQVVSVGRKLRDQLLRRKVSLLADFSDMPEQPTTSDVRPIVKMIQDGYLVKDYAEVVLVYPQFVNAMVQKPMAKLLLPLNITEMTKLDVSVEAVPEENLVWNEFVFEPSRELILDELIPGYLETQIYQARLETVASEYSARMVAMKNATSNARDVRGYLTLEYNNVRQSQITRELAEISAGRLARS